MRLHRLGTHQQFRADRCIRQPAAHEIRDPPFGRRERRPADRGTAAFAVGTIDKLYRFVDGQSAALRECPNQLP